MSEKRFNKTFKRGKICENTTKDPVIKVFPGGKCGHEEMLLRGNES